MEDLSQDVELLCANAELYNKEETIYYKAAQQLRADSRTILQAARKKSLVVFGIAADGKDIEEVAISKGYPETIRQPEASQGPDNPTVEASAGEPGATMDYLHNCPQTISHRLLVCKASSTLLAFTAYLTSIYRPSYIPLNLVQVCSRKLLS